MLTFFLVSKTFFNFLFSHQNHFQLFLFHLLQDEHWELASRVIGVTNLFASTDSFAVIVENSFIVGWGGPSVSVGGQGQKAGSGYYIDGGHKLPTKCATHNVCGTRCKCSKWGVPYTNPTVTEAQPFPPFKTKTTLPCPLGHQPVGKTCIACAPGKKTPGAESVQCRACEAGLISSPAAIHCGHCAAGQYEKTTNDEPCQTCPSGKHSIFWVILSSLHF